MYAVIESSGRQYSVSEGDIIKLDHVAAAVGTNLDFNKVIMLNDGGNVKLGAPYVDGVTISTEVLDHVRGKKVNIIKFKRRKNHIKRMGFRHDFTQVKVKQIVVK